MLLSMTRSRSHRTA